MIIGVLVITGWSYGARQLRAQALSLRNRDFLESARVRGERRSYIIVFEVLPTMTSLILANFLGSALYAVLTAAGLQFIGLGDNSSLSWGTMLHWAQSNAALQTGQPLWVVAPGLCIASWAPPSRCSTTPSTRSATPHYDRSGGPVASALVPERPRARGAGPHRRVRHGRRSRPRGGGLRPRRPAAASSSASSGESGCGKSTMLFGIAQLLSPPARISAGSVSLPGPGPGHHDRDGAVGRPAGATCRSSCRAR